MLIKTAIEEAINEIKDQPWLLDFCLQFYLNDELTAKLYGQKSLEQAVQFFMATDFPVRLDVAAEQASTPTITIIAGDGSESWTTLADTAETPVERVDTRTIIAQNPLLTFTPAKFDAATGTVTLNTKHNTDDVWPQMRVLDTVNSKHYRILDVTGDQSFVIDSDPQNPPNLKRAQIVDQSDLWIVSLESATQRESYQIVCEAQGDPLNVIVLHSALLFGLYRNKNKLLHQRGFENVGIGKSALTGPYSAGDAQLFFRRSIQLNGHVTNTWPGEIRPALQGINLQLAVHAPGSGDTYEDNNEGVPGLKKQGWRTVDGTLINEDDIVGPDDF